MIARGKRSVLGVRVDVADYEGAVAAIAEAAAGRRAFGATALAVHGVMTGVLDRRQRFRLNRLDLVLPDGQPVRWALALLHREPLPDRVYGPELMMRLCREAELRALSVFLYGNGAAVLLALRDRLETRFPRLRIAGAEPSRYRSLDAVEEEALQARILASGADLVLVGLGCPRQEVFAFEHAERLSMPVVAVGAAFDFHAGRLPQAPRRMQRHGLEWVFRLGCEPARLWRRYLLLNPLYLVLVALQRLGLAEPWLARETAPEAPLRHG